MQRKPHKLHLLLHSAALVEEQLRLRLAPLGIRPRQARILNALRRMGTASQVDLAREFDVTAASMSTMTSRLIAAGLISRQPDPKELRSNVLSLTESGRAMLADIHEVWDDVDRMIEQTIGAGKAQTLAALTLELRDALGGRVPGKGLRDHKAETEAADEVV